MSVKNDGEALQFANSNFANDREVVLAAVNQTGFALEFASDLLKNDEDVALAALFNCSFAYVYVGDNLKKNKSFQDKIAQNDLNFKKYFFK